MYNLHRTFKFAQSFDLELRQLVRSCKRFHDEESYLAKISVSRGYVDASVDLHDDGYYLRALDHSACRGCCAT